MNFLVLSLFPEMFHNLMGLVQTGRDEKKFNVETLPIRDYGVGKYKKVDDQVFGGSDGMLLMPEVLSAALAAAKAKEGFSGAKVVALSPKGQVWNQRKAQEWAEAGESKILICGRYAGFDHRFISKECDEEISIGDFILNGGEVAALTIIESVVRLIPGVLGNESSATDDSFSAQSNLLEAPQYTKPRDWQGLQVPEILLSGHHENIKKWKQVISITETFLKRKDLISSKHLQELEHYLKDKTLFESLKEVYSQDDMEKFLGIINY